MGCSVRELLIRFGSLELAEWKAYLSIEPFGYDLRVDEQLATIAYVLFQVNAKKGKKFSIEEFMQVRPKPQQQSQAMIKTLIKGALGAFKAKGTK